MRRCTGTFCALALAVALVAFATGCSSSDSADATALPNADAPRIGVALDAEVTAPADLPTFDDENGIGLVPEGGHYQIGVRQPQSVVTATLDEDFPVDQVVTATFDSTGGPKDMGFGIVCRMQDLDNYYRLGIANDGNYAIQRVKDGHTNVLTGNGVWTRDEAIRRSGGVFTLRAECVGHTLTLFEGNRQIATLRDATSEGRKAGVFVESFFEPNAKVQVDALSVRAFRNRARVSGVAADGWEDLLRTQRVSNRCELLDPKATGTGKHTAFATRCGAVLFVQMDSADQGARTYNRILRDVGATDTSVKKLPDCPKRSGIRGPLPPPTPAGFTDTRTSIGRVACVEADDATAVLWLHELPGVIGLTTIASGDRAAWKDYGPDWPPFAYEQQPG